MRVRRFPRSQDFLNNVFLTRSQDRARERLPRHCPAGVFADAKSDLRMSSADHLQTIRRKCFHGSNRANCGCGSVADRGRYRHLCCKSIPANFVKKAAFGSDDLLSLATDADRERRFPPEIFQKRYCISFWVRLAVSTSVARDMKDMSVTVGGSEIDRCDFVSDCVLRKTV